MSGKPHGVYSHLLDVIERKGAAYLMLLDPDKASGNSFQEFIATCEQSGVDGFLIGGSLLFTKEMTSLVAELKSATSIPAIIFPGDTSQVVAGADAILFISIVSGRNPEHLIGKQVLAAPLIHRYGIEPISTGYMLIDSGVRTAAEYMSGSQPIPANKPDIALATALAAEFLGMKFVYLEAGSGAMNHVPTAMISLLAQHLSIPIIAGGGIRTPGTAAELVRAGAKIIVTGNHFETSDKHSEIPAFAQAVHWKESALA